MDPYRFLKRMGKKLHAGYKFAAPDASSHGVSGKCVKKKKDGLYYKMKIS